MLIAAWVVEATDVYIYMRDEYPDVIKFLKKEIKILEEKNLNIKQEFILEEVLAPTFVVKSHQC